MTHKISGWKNLTPAQAELVEKVEAFEVQANEFITMLEKLNGSFHIRPRYLKIGKDHAKLSVDALKKSIMKQEFY